MTLDVWIVFGVLIVIVLIGFGWVMKGALVPSRNLRMPYIRPVPSLIPAQPPPVSAGMRLLMYGILAPGNQLDTKTEGVVLDYVASRLSTALKPSTGLRDEMRFDVRTGFVRVRSVYDDNIADDTAVVRGSGWVRFYLPVSTFDINARLMVADLDDELHFDPKQPPKLVIDITPFVGWYRPALYRDGIPFPIAPRNQLEPAFATSVETFVRIQLARFRPLGGEPYRLLGFTASEGFSFKETDGGIPVRSLNGALDPRALHMVAYLSEQFLHPDYYAAKKAHS